MVSPILTCLFTSSIAYSVLVIGVSSHMYVPNGFVAYVPNSDVVLPLRGYVGVVVRLGICFSRG